MEGGGRRGVGEVRMCVTHTVCVCARAHACVCVRERERGGEVRGI